MAYLFLDFRSIGQAASLRVLTYVVGRAITASVHFCVMSGRSFLALPANSSFESRVQSISRRILYYLVLFRFRCPWLQFIQFLLAHPIDRIGAYRFWKKFKGIYINDPTKFKKQSCELRMGRDRYNSTARRLASTTPF